MYYAGHNRFGISFTYSSQGWEAYAFNSRKNRDDFVSKHEHDGQNYVMQVIDKKTADKIAGRKSYLKLELIDISDNGSDYPAYMMYYR